MGPTVIFAGLSALGVWFISKLKDSPNSSVVNMSKATTVSFNPNLSKGLGPTTVVASAPPNFASSKAGGAGTGGSCCCRNGGQAPGAGSSKGPTLVSAAPLSPSLGTAGQVTKDPGQGVKDYGPFSFLGV